MSPAARNAIYGGIEDRQLAELLREDAARAFETIESPELAVETAVGLVRLILSHVPLELRPGAGRELIARALS